MATNSYAAKDGKLFMEVKRLMEGRPDAYQNVYDLSKNYIYKIINDIVQNHHTTEDLMQETYLQIYRKIDTLKEPTAFYVWAGRIATNLTLRYVQKYRNEVAFAQVSEEEDTGTIFDRVQNDYEEFIPETVLHNTEQQRIIADILDGLSVEQKISVQYYYFEEMSVNDIAEEMQCSPGTVKSRLNYARKALKEAISKFEVANDVKLYSLASIPVFYFVFRYAAEGLLTTGAILGTGAVATAEQAQEVCAEIRRVIKKNFGAKTARSVSILYGGSMNAVNAEKLLSMSDIDGGLIGGASLNPQDFSKIIAATNQE